MPDVEGLALLEDDRGTWLVASSQGDSAFPVWRIDGASRWSGVALVEGRTLGATAAVLGDWDLPSTLLRRTLQAGARLRPTPEEREPLLAENPGDLELFDRSLIAKSRGPRTDFASRYVLPPIEDFATEKVLEGRSIRGLYPATDPQSKIDFEAWRKAKGR